MKSLHADDNAENRKQWVLSDKTLTVILWKFTGSVEDGHEKKGTGFNYREWQRDFNCERKHGVACFYLKFQLTQILKPASM